MFVDGVDGTLSNKSSSVMTVTIYVTSLEVICEMRMQGIHGFRMRCSGEGSYGDLKVLAQMRARDQHPTTSAS